MDFGACFFVSFLENIMFFKWEKTVPYGVILPMLLMKLKMALKTR